MTQRLKELITKWHKDANIYGFDVMLDCALELEAAIKPQWVPVGERLPTILQDVWVFNGQPEIAWWSPASKSFKDLDGDVIRNVTHWMTIDLPQPPETTH